MADDKEAAWAKIRITQSINELLQYGPSIKVGIAPVPFKGAGMMTVLAQIDTGAAGSGLSSKLTRKLGLNPVGEVEIREPGRKPIKANEYRVRLFLPSTDVEMNVVGLFLHPPHDVLIGRDVLANCRLAIDFTTGLVGLHIRSS